MAKKKKALQKIKLHKEIKSTLDLTSFLQDTIEKAYWFQKKKRYRYYVKRSRDKTARKQSTAVILALCIPQVVKELKWMDG